MKLRLVLVAALVALVAAPVFAQPDTRVLARVEADSITVSDFERSYVAMLLQTGRNDTPAHRYEHLEDLLRIHLLAREARRQGFDEDPGFKVFEEQTRRQALASRFYETALVETLPPLTDAEIRQAFARSKQQVVLRHLFYRDEAAARAAHARLVAGRDFLAEAQDCYRLAAIDSSAGYLGPVRYFQVDDAVAQAAFALDVGAFSAPVRSRFGYHILRVEDKIASPILTESEYQARKDGLAAQLSQRRRRLDGDAFVRAYMDGLGVRVVPEGIAALRRAIEALDPPAEAQPAALAAPKESPSLDVEALQMGFRPETPLARYTFDGQPQTFTAGDYFFWLEALPSGEVRQRTAASVGRALRNEVFARAAMEQGLADDAYVVREMARQGRLYLAQQLQAARQDGTLPASEGTQETAPTMSVDTQLFEQIMTLGR